MRLFFKESLFHFCEEWLFRKSSFRTRRLINCSISDGKHNDCLLRIRKSENLPYCCRIKSFHRTRVDFQFSKCRHSKSLRNVCLSCRPCKSICWVSLTCNKTCNHILISFKMSTYFWISAGKKSKKFFFILRKIATSSEYNHMRCCSYLWLIPCCCLDFIFDFLAWYYIKVIWLHTERCRSKSYSFKKSIEISISNFSRRIKLLCRVSPI